MGRDRSRNEHSPQTSSDETGDETTRALPLARKPPRGDGGDLRTHPSRRKGGRAGLINDATSTILQQLTDRRHELDLTQAQLAERAGTSQRTVSQIECFQQNPKLSTVLAIGNALGLTLVLEPSSPKASDA